MSFASFSSSLRCSTSSSRVERVARVARVPCSIPARVSRPQRSGATALVLSRSSHSSSTNTPSSASTVPHSAKSKAWYLDPTPPATSSTPASSRNNTTETPKPRFTTFDPLRTTPSPSSESTIRPLPSNAPDYLEPLHEFLTTNGLLDPGSVSFMHAPNSNHAMDQKNDAAGSEELISGAQPTWEWVIVGVVKGRGKGVIARSERSLRVWVSCGCHDINVVQSLSSSVVQDSDTRCSQFNALEYNADSPSSLF